MTTDQEDFETTIIKKEIEKRKKKRLEDASNNSIIITSSISEDEDHNLLLNNFIEKLLKNKKKKIPSEKVSTKIENKRTIVEESEIKCNTKKNEDLLKTEFIKHENNKHIKTKNKLESKIKLKNKLEPKIKPKKKLESKVSDLSFATISSYIVNNEDNEVLLKPTKMKKKGKTEKVEKHVAINQKDYGIKLIKKEIRKRKKEKVYDSAIVPLTNTSNINGNNENNTLLLKMITKKKKRKKDKTKKIMITETVEQEDLKTKIRKTNTVKLQNKKKFKDAAEMTNINNNSNNFDVDNHLKLLKSITKKKNISKEKDKTEKVLTVLETKSFKRTLSDNCAAWNIFKKQKLKNGTDTHIEETHFSKIYKYEESFTLLKNYEKYKNMDHIKNRCTYNCEHCDKKFKFASSLFLHKNMRFVNNFCECLICHKIFSQMSYLYRHFRMHTGEKLFLCNVCGRSFTLSSYLITHKRVHSGERPYSCHICGRSFSEPYKLKGHMRLHTGEKPFVCNVCGSSFRLSSFLVIHKRIHSGKRPYSCHICGLSFNQSHVLKEHIRLHTGEKPYKCDFCKSMFVTSSALKKHSKRIHLKDFH